MKKQVQKALSALLVVVMILGVCAPICRVSAANELTTVKKWNLTLSDQIGANFYVSISDSVSADAVMNVTDGYGTTAYSLGSVPKDAEGNYIFTASLAAAQMGDTVSLQLQDGDQVGQLHTYRAVDYARTVLSGNYGESTKALVKAMLNYGAAAQTYFGYNADALVNEGYESTENVEIPAVDTSDMVSGKLDGISFYGASLVFTSKVAVRFYFTVSGNIADYSFSTGAQPVLKDGKYYVEVSGINPQDYANAITLTVNDELTVSYSPLTYISRMANSADEELVDLVKAMYQYHEASVAFESGEAFEGAAGMTISLGNEEELESISFDYKIVEGTKFNIALMNADWENGYGYFCFTADGVSSYNGVTTELLENGYVRATFDVAALTTVMGAPTSVVDVLYIRGNDWSDANGYIKNVTYTVYQPQLVFEGAEFTSDYGLVYELPNKQAVSRMTFDYKIESGYFHISLICEDWNNFFGYFKFDVNGAANNYEGVVTRKLEDGSIRVYMDLSALTAITGAAPSDVVKILYIRSDWTTANGTISNICINEAAEIAPRGQLIKQGVGNTFELTNTVALGSLSFDYKIINGAKFAVALMPDWSSYYGYYDFNADGAASAYSGVTTKVLEDGYVRVTFDMAALDAIAGEPTGVITLLYFRNNYCQADAYIDNIQYGEDAPEPEETEPEETEPEETEPEVTEPEVTEPAPSYNFEAGSGATVVLSNDKSVSKLSFDYKFESGNKMVLALMPDWSNYFGNYEFNAEGLINAAEGVTTYRLEDGFVRVIFDLATLDKISGAPSDVITMIYVNARYTDATGVICNICLNDAVEVPEVSEPEETEPEAVIRGEAIEAGADKTIMLENTEVLETVSFEYKVTDGEKFNLALLKDWHNFYSYYVFTANGPSQSYQGVSYEVLSDGYIRVTFELAALDKITGNPTGVIDFLFIRGGWSDVNGYIDNVSYTVYNDNSDIKNEVFEGGAFASGTGASIEIANDQAVAKMTFDYKIESGEYFHIALIDEDWNNFFGYFKFNVNGALGVYPGVVTKELDDGSIRVYMDMTAVTTIVGAAPSDVVKLLYVRGNWTTANGTISNICINGAAEAAPRGETITAGADKTINPIVSGELTTISFDYKIESGEKINVALMPNWISFYGFFELNAEATNVYNGVTYEKLSDGYIRVTFDMAALTKMSGTPSTAIDFLYIRGDWSDANGYIDNVQFSV